jgi:hypothetical protein
VSKSVERKASGMSVLDGAHLLAAFLDSGRTPEEVLVNSAGAEDPEVAELVRRSAPAPVTQLSDALFKSLSTVDSPTGVIASVRTPEPGAVPADAPLVLLLENIQDPGNVGTLLRSAAAAGARPRAALAPVRLRVVAEGASRRDGCALRAQHPRGRGPLRIRRLVQGHRHRAHGARRRVPL